MQIPPASTPIACDMSTARDTPEERLAEYRRLFAQALVGTGTDRHRHPVPLPRGARPRGLGP